MLVPLDIIVDFNVIAHTLAYIMVFAQGYSYIALNNENSCSLYQVLAAFEMSNKLKNWCIFEHDSGYNISFYCTVSVGIVDLLREATDTATPHGQVAHPSCR